jgi:hypothetical protein
MAQDAHLAATEAQAQALAVDAYIYFYPLLSMDISRRTFTNVEPGKVFGKGPMNTFTNVPAYPQDHQEDRTGVVHRSRARADHNRAVEDARHRELGLPASSSRSSAGRS